MRDIVYILKPRIKPDELRYSLRSIEKNFPHGLVWFVGSRPLGFQPDRMIEHIQTGPTKWDRIKSSMLRVVQEEELSDEFFLFNDDFFVMKPFRGEFKNFADRSLADRIDDFEKENNINAYCRTLMQARSELAAAEKPTANFEVHLPMIFEKKKVAEAITRYSSPQMRSLYGNDQEIEFIDRRDVKVYTLDSVPEDPDFVSTSNKTFEYGIIGKYIRDQFRASCRYEERGDL